jgi:hypothetical protein
MGTRMNRHLSRLFASPCLFLSLIAGAGLLTASNVAAQCNAVELVSGLRLPQGIVQSNQANLLVAESGTTLPNTGRISILDRRGNRRTLIDGLPSGLNDVNEPSGPARLFMRGRTLYVTIAVGDVGISGGAPGTALRIRTRFLHVSVLWLTKAPVNVITKLLDLTDAKE